MKKCISALLLVLLGIGLTGCADPNSSVTKQDVGVISGAVIGGLVGSRFGGGSGQVAAIGAGTVAGAFIGGSIGKNMDDTDRLRMTQALETHPIGKPAYWQNERTGATYTVTPVSNVTRGDNPYCREYRTVANIAGKTQQVYGTACRQVDGSWKIMDSRSY